MSTLQSMTVWHKRAAPKIHQFHYPYLFARLKIRAQGILSLDESTILKFNQFSLLSINEKDYLFDNTKSLYHKLLDCFDNKTWKNQIVYFDWFTSPKLLGLGFNPVSFYFARDAKKQILGVLVEVNNTFKERHLYFLDGLEQDGAKEFHVSPFNNCDGIYHFHFTDPDDAKLDFRIELVRDDKLVFTAGIVGQWKSHPHRSEHRQIIKSHFSPWMTLIWIHLQAFTLFFIKRLKFYKKLNTNHPHTIIKNNG